MREISGERRLPACIPRQLADEFPKDTFRQAAEKDRLAACAPQNKNYTRERLRPLLRVYFTGRRFGSILASPVPLFTSMI